jgi:hypothetical protein
LPFKIKRGGRVEKMEGTHANNQEKYTSHSRGPPPAYQQHVNGSDIDTWKIANATGELGTRECN